MNAGEAPHARGSPDARAAARHASRAGATYSRFVRAVAEQGGYPVDDAEAYAVAVVATLEEKLPLRDVLGLEAQLPSRLAEMLEREPILDLPAMDGGELCARVAIRLGVTATEAVSIARIVFRVLRLHVSPGEARHVERQLPSDLRRLWSDAV